MVKTILIAVMITCIFLLALQARASAHPRVGPQDASGNESVRIIGSRPAGCPSKYCGCGLAQFLGLTDKRLNKASEWARLFPLTEAQPGAAAVRKHHVMLLISQAQRPHLWLVRDYNSGGGLSRIWVRSVKGFQFVKVGVSSNGLLASTSLNHYDGRGSSSHSNKATRTRGRHFDVPVGAFADLGSNKITHGAIQ